MFSVFGVCDLTFPAFDKDPWVGILFPHGYGFRRGAHLGLGKMLHFSFMDLNPFGSETPRVRGFLVHKHTGDVCVKHVWQ